MIGKNLDFWFQILTREIEKFRGVIDGSPWQLQKM